MIFVLALVAIKDAPLCNWPKSNSFEWERVPSGKTPTTSPSFNNLILELIAALSKVPRLIGIAPVAFNDCFMNGILNNSSFAINRIFLSKNAGNNNGSWLLKWFPEITTPFAFSIFSPLITVTL